MVEAPLEPVGDHARGQDQPPNPVAVQLASGRVSLAAEVLMAPRVEPDWVLPGLPVGEWA